MSNIINSQIINSNNVIPAQDITMGKKSDNYIVAPDSLPKCTASSIERNCDEFRKQVTQNQIETMLKKQRKISPKFGVFLAAVAAFSVWVLRHKS